MASAMDYYAILGVAPDSEEVVIQAAYRALMRRYHPDTNASPEATERATAINAAYSILSDPVARAAYDRSRRGAEPNQSAGSQQRAKADSEGPPHHPDTSRTNNQPLKARQAASHPRALAAYALIVAVSGGLIAAVFLGGSNETANVANDGIDNLTVDNLVIDDATTDGNLYELNFADGTETAVAEKPASLSSQTQSSVDYSIIEGAAERFSRTLMASGIIGARSFSERCHEETKKAPTWSAADACAAFDYAAAYIDQSISRQSGMPITGYFQFQRENQSDNYAEIGAPSYSVYRRLEQIRKAAEAAALYFVQAELARDQATRQLGADPVAPELNSDTPNVAESAPATGEDENLP